ncbi:hypothetical protein M758_7G157200 [Ceratodon purpureus]|nr:hypothetical protein M758_7G157200 [Ceratodon purpureus]
MTPSLPTDLCLLTLLHELRVVDLLANISEELVFGTGLHCSHELCPMIKHYPIANEILVRLKLCWDFCDGVSFHLFWKKLNIFATMSDPPRMPSGAKCQKNGLFEV